MTITSDIYRDEGEFSGFRPFPGIHHWSELT